MTYAGAQFGTVISYPISGYLIDACGWRSVFYVFGAVSALWGIVFFFVGSDSPLAASEKGFCGISEPERKYIESALGVYEQVSPAEDNKVSISHH